MVTAPIWTWTCAREFRGENRRRNACGEMRSGKLTGRHACRAGKYLWVQKDHVKDRAMWAEGAKWQYWVDDGVDGKADGVPPPPRAHKQTLTP